MFVGQSVEMILHPMKNPLGIGVRGISTIGCFRFENFLNPSAIKL